MKNMIKKKKPIIDLSEIPEGIFGALVPELKYVPEEAKPSKKKKKVKQTPKLKTSKVVKKKKKTKKIDYKLPVKNVVDIRTDTRKELLPDLEYANIAEVPEDVLELVTKKTDLRTKSLSEIMLLSIVPSIMAFDASAAYVKAALRDGLGVDADLEDNALEAFKMLSNLEILNSMVNKMNIPPEHKQRTLKILTDKLSEAAAETLIKKLKSNDMSKKLQDLQGVVMRRLSDSKTRTHEPKEKKND